MRDEESGCQHTAKCEVESVNFVMRIIKANCICLKFVLNSFHFMVAHRDKTLPRIQKLPIIQSTSQNPKLFPESKELSRIHNTSQNPKTLPRIKKHFPESKNN